MLAGRTDVYVFGGERGHDQIKLLSISSSMRVLLSIGRSCDERVDLLGWSSFHINAGA